MYLHAKPFGVACLLALVMACSNRTDLASKVFTDTEIKALLQDRVDRAKSNVGIVVGLVDAKGTRIVAYGKSGLDRSQPVDGDTVFEIGSVTKVFTDTLMVDMAERGELSLNDPLSKHLPSTVKTPTRGGKEITLLTLANHVSGLPRLPTNFAPKDEQNPYADYTVQQMYSFLSSYALPRDIGGQYEYSNFGVGLLGHILTLRANTDYESLVRTRICQPLGMDDTRVTLTPGMEARLAQGHNEQGVPVVNWDLPTLPGAGALRSTAKDLLKFAAANLGLGPNPLSSSMRRMQEPVPGSNQPYIGWYPEVRGKRTIICHRGTTAGYCSFIGFDRKHGQGVVVLSNSATDVDDIGIYLLTGDRYDLKERIAPSERKAMQLEPKVFDAYVGKYRITPSYHLTFSREGHRFFAQAGDAPKFEIFAETPTDFFRNGVNVRASFVKDRNGSVQHVVLHSKDGDSKAVKVL